VPVECCMTLGKPLAKRLVAVIHDPFGPERLKPRAIPWKSAA
jgi:hypothetical protein